MTQSLCVDIIITGWNLYTCRYLIKFLAPLPGIECFIQVYFSVLESLLCFDSVLLTGLLFVLFSICEETNQSLSSTIRNPNSQSAGGEPTSGLSQPWQATKVEDQFRIRRKKPGLKQQSKSALLRDCDSNN